MKSTKVAAPAQNAASRTTTMVRRRDMISDAAGNMPTEQSCGPRGTRRAYGSIKFQSSRFLRARQDAAWPARPIALFQDSADRALAGSKRLKLTGVFYLTD